MVRHERMAWGSPVTALKTKDTIPMWPAIFLVVLAGFVFAGLFVERELLPEWRSGIHPYLLLAAGVALVGLAIVFVLWLKLRKAELLALQASEARYRSLFETAPIPIVEQDLSALKAYIDTLRDHGIQDLATHLETHPDDLRRAASLIKADAANQAALDFFAVTSFEELLAATPAMVAADPGRSFSRGIVALARGHHRFADAVTTVKIANGDERQIRLHMALDPLQGATWRRVVTSIFDVTDQQRVEQALRQAGEELEVRVAKRTAEIDMINQGLRDEIEARRATEEELRTTLAEKDLLSREVSHRVRNNFAMVIALLDLQAGYINDPAAVASLRELQQRVQAMAMAHQRLYRSAIGDRIDMEPYTRDLVANLVHAFGSHVHGLGVGVGVARALWPIDTAIPCGMLLTELISNALKHAYVADPAPDVNHLLQVAVRSEPTNLVLEVADNGKGLPPDIRAGGRETLGMRLVGILADQLRATVQVRSAPGLGTTVTVTMPPPEAEPGRIGPLATSAGSEVNPT